MSVTQSGLSTNTLLKVSKKTISDQTNNNVGNTVTQRLANIYHDPKPDKIYLKKKISKKN